MVAIDEKHASQSEEVKAPMSSLSEQEKEIIERQLDAPKLQIGYFALFRYASKNEVLIMVAALVASIAAGAVMPLMTVRAVFFLTFGYFQGVEPCADTWNTLPWPGNIIIRKDLYGVKTTNNPIRSYTATLLEASRVSLSMLLQLSVFKIKSTRSHCTLSTLVGLLAHYSSIEINIYQVLPRSSHHGSVSSAFPTPESA